MDNPLKATTGRVITKETPGIQILKANPLTITLHMPTDSTITTRATLIGKQHTLMLLMTAPLQMLNQTIVKMKGNGHQSETSDTESKNYLVPLNASN